MTRRLRGLVARSGQVEDRRLSLAFLRMAAPIATTSSGEKGGPLFARDFSVGQNPFARRFVPSRQRNRRLKPCEELAIIQARGEIAEGFSPLRSTGRDQDNV
jgi:hypothetical protein